MTQAEVIDEITRRLEEAAPAGSEIVLFGSRAREDAADDSDCDVLVIEPEIDRPMAESARLRRTLSNLDCPIDIVVFSAARAATAIEGLRPRKPSLPASEVPYERACAWRT